MKLKRISKADHEKIAAAARAAGFDSKREVDEGITTASYSKTANVPSIYLQDHVHIAVFSSTIRVGRYSRTRRNFIASETLFGQPARDLLTVRSILSAIENMQRVEQRHSN